MIHHPCYKFPESHARLPTQLVASLGGIAEQTIHVCGTEVAGINLDMVVPIKTAARGCLIQKLTHGMGFSGGDYIIGGLGPLKHKPHGLDVIPGIPPVTLCLQIA